MNFSILIFVYYEDLEICSHMQILGPQEEKRTLFVGTRPRRDLRSHRDSPFLNTLNWFRNTGSLPACTLYFRRAMTWDKVL